MQPSNSLSSDRLRKAIERNRAKQAKRTTTLSTPSRPTRAVGQSPTVELSANKWELPGTSRRARTATPTTSGRRSVAKPEDVQFSTELRKSPGKAPASVSYVGTKAKTTTTRRVASTTRRKSAKKQNNWLIYGAWAFCAVLLVRLVFSGGGVIDYYQSQSFLKSKAYEYKSIVKENEELAVEIQKIKKNRSYQKKLVRDNLGFIAKDEFLILFPKEKSGPSI